VLTFRRLFRGL